MTALNAHNPLAANETFAAPAGRHWPSGRLASLVSKDTTNAQQRYLPEHFTDYPLTPY